MFAVLKTGGKQYRVRTGDVLRVEKLAADAGETIQFNEILMVGGTVGTPYVDDAAVQAQVIDQIKGEKVIHFVKRRRKHGSQRTKGHRQELTLLRVTGILETGGSTSDAKAAVGAGHAPRDGSGDGRYALNRTQQSEMKRRVNEGEAAEKAVAEGAPVPTSPAEAARHEAGAEPRRPDLLEAPRNGQADDLKKLSGVGPKLEQTLNENGVFHYDQIAGWGPAEIAFMDEQLSFKGRIEREGWVDQARALSQTEE